MEKKFEKFAMTQKQVDSGVSQWFKIGLILNPREDRNRVAAGVTLVLHELSNYAPFIPKIQHSARGASLALLHYDRGAHFCIAQYDLGTPYNAIDVLRDNQIHENFIIMLKPRDSLALKEQLFLQTKCKNYGVWYDGEDHLQSRSSLNRALARVGLNDVPMPKPVQQTQSKKRNYEESFFCAKQELVTHFEEKLTSFCAALEKVKKSGIKIEASELDKLIEELNLAAQNIVPASEAQGKIVLNAKKFQIREMAGEK